MNSTGDPQIDAFLEDCLTTMHLKGQDYTQGAPDRLHNFRTVAGFLGLTMEDVWSVYFYKHAAAVFLYCRNGQVESEPIRGRIMDCIVYLLLLYKMTIETKEAP